jgi:hypothetical protein
MKTGSYVISAHPNEPTWKRLEELDNVTLYAADSNLNECWQLIETDEEGYGFLQYHFTIKPAAPGVYIDCGGAEQVVLEREGKVYDALDFRGKYSDIEEALQNAGENDLVCEAPGGGWELFPTSHPVGWYINGSFVKLPKGLELASVRMPRISHDDCEVFWCPNCKNTFQYREIDEEFFTDDEQHTAYCPQCCDMGEDGAESQSVCVLGCMMSDAAHIEECEAQTYKLLAEEAGEPQFPSF